MAARTRQVSLAALAERSIVTPPKALSVVPAVSTVPAPTAAGAATTEPIAPAEPEDTAAAPAAPDPVVGAVEAAALEAPPVQEDVVEPARVQGHVAAHRKPVPSPAAPVDRPGSSAEPGSAPAPGQWVRFDQLERKETRLRADQYSSLTDVSRGLNRVRAGAGERITENTLIRIAIDLLLSQRGKLHGATEAELRNSVGL